MLQIIIWLGCLYLVLKGVEILLSSLPLEKQAIRQGWAVTALVVAMMGALPGSSSQRNAERHGFHIAYTRIKWQRETSTGN